MGIFKSFILSYKQSKIRKKISASQETAMKFQRNGKLREYAEVMKSIEELEAEYASLSTQVEEVS